MEKSMEKQTEKEKPCVPPAGSTSSSPHVLIFPCPAQGHVNCMLKLAELLALHNLHVTFLNTQYIYNRLIRFSDIEALSECYPKLQFKTIPDYYSEEQHPGFGEQLGKVVVSLDLYAEPLLRDILISSVPKVSCIIIDGIIGNLTTNLAAEFGIPNIHFRTISACCIWAYFCVPKLIQCHELPIRGDEDMDRIISNTPGMENLLRCRDLPSFCRPNSQIDLDDIVLRTQQTLKQDTVILNTFEDLESPILSQIRLHSPKLYTIGPLHHHLNARKETLTTKTSFKSNFFQVDTSCITWLQSQPHRSVIYVSFGSITSMKKEEIIEIWHGLVNSKQRFLWVIRPDMMPLELELEDKEGANERGCIVSWAPQEEVLAHKAVGGFLTHCGWNSTLESVVAGVPMICWPYFGDQQVNSRFVSEVWKLGLDMKDVCDRNVVEKMVNDVMVNRKEEFLRTAQEMAELAHKSVSQGGSSHTSMDDLIQFINSTS